MQYLLTSESVAPGHPDKVCDQISDAIVDAYLSIDPLSHTAIETFASINQVIIGGEIWGPFLSLTELETIVRDVVKDIGYEQEDFHWKTFNFRDLIHRQSEDLVNGLSLDKKTELGAGDQGVMIGFACDETDVLLPAPIFYAHRIMENIQVWRLQNPSSGLGMDGKSQVTMRYENGVPTGAHAIVVSLQHHQDTDVKALRDKIWPIVEASLPPGWMCSDENFYFNPMGRFVLGGPAADCGLTGRKIIIDSYGGLTPHGGGSFSGKDPTKVDRSAAYMLRYIAKNVVAAGLAKRCTIQISYAIGRSSPIALYVTTHQTGVLPDKELMNFIQNNINLTPEAICKTLQLNRPIYRPTANYGHFGRPPQQNGCFSWERLDLLKQFKELRA